MDLGTWADWVAAAATAGTLGVAVVAALYAKRQVDHAREERTDRNRPFVTVALEPSHSLVANIVIRNNGATLAKDVHFTFDPPWVSSDPERTKIRESKIWTEGIPSLVPGAELRIFADTFPERHKTDLPTSYSVQVTCRGADSATFSETYVLDFDVFHGYSTATLYGMHELADAVRAMNRKMADWSEHVGGPLSVVTRDGEKIDAEEEGEFARRQAMIEAKRAAEQEAADGEQHDVLPLHDHANDFHAQRPITRPAPLQTVGRLVDRLRRGRP
jgi:hypothetical protein